MSDPQLTRTLVYVMFGLAVATVLGLVFVTAPYGRHTRGGWGPTIPSRVGWIVMESPGVFAFVGFYLLGPNRAHVVPLVLLGLWQIHYLHRTFIFPFTIREQGKRMPLAIAAMAIAFNLLNAWINARWLSAIGEYPLPWLYDPRMLVGVVVFFTGLAMNIRADRRLARLRAPGETGYKIPRGGMHEYVSSPNYLGEIVEWFGFALAAWSLAGLAFAVYTVANLAPRAFSNHAWYRRTFPDYPPQRKALIPFVL